MKTEDKPITLRHLRLGRAVWYRYFADVFCDKNKFSRTLFLKCIEDVGRSHCPHRNQDAVLHSDLDYYSSKYISELNAYIKMREDLRGEFIARFTSSIPGNNDIYEWSEKFLMLAETHFARFFESENLNEIPVKAYRNLVYGYFTGIRPDLRGHMPSAMNECRSNETISKLRARLSSSKEESIAGTSQEALQNFLERNMLPGQNYKLSF